MGSDRSPEPVGQLAVDHRRIRIRHGHRHQCVQACILLERSSGGRRDLVHDGSLLPARVEGGEASPFGGARRALARTEGRALEPAGNGLGIELHVTGNLTDGQPHLAMEMLNTVI